MRCNVCQAENPDRAQFCMECGRALAPVCSQCGHELAEGARFCVECGTRAGTAAQPEKPVGEVFTTPRTYTPPHLAQKILGSRAAVEGERKQVTVLFADVSESMNLAEQLDPEEWHGILDGFFSILSGAVHRFEGTVNQYTGDGIMALFGAPIAHEDHAQRACYAALQMRTELTGYAAELRRSKGLNFSVRIGLNSGEVVVGAIGDDLRMDYTAQGHTVGLAARIEQRAAPGDVYLAEPTARLVEGYFHLRDLGEFVIRGVHGGVRVFSLIERGAAKTRLDVARSRGLSRFVGRDVELAAMEEALGKAAARQRQVVGVFGEAGAGKSRLCQEFIARARHRGTSVYQATCVAHGSRIPFLPVLDLLRAYFGIREHDDSKTTREKIAGRLLMIDADMFKPRLPFIFDFLGVADPAQRIPEIEPEVRQQMLYEGWKRSMEADASGEPEIILIEDLHWIDGASDSFLANLTGLLADTRTLLLVNARPGYDAPWMHDPSYRQIELRPLDAEAIGELLVDLIGSDPSTGALRNAIGERTGGNPFFVEEVVRSLVDAGALLGQAGAYRTTGPVDATSVPPTVQAVLAARIDRLDVGDKQVLETAAVLGKMFSETMLAAATGLEEPVLSPTLDRLEAGGFVEKIATFPQVEYLFNHPLTRDVAYRSQLAARRAGLHRRVAEAIESECCGRSDENAALLAHHWAGAGETLRAVRWSHRAAKWAASRDQAEAYRHWQSIRDLLDDCSECNESLGLGVEARIAMLEMGWRLAAPRDEQRRLFDEALALAARIGDRTAEARVLAGFSMGESFSGRVAEALQLLERATRIAEETDDPALNFRLGSRLAYAHLLAGNLETALRLLETALGASAKIEKDQRADEPFDPRFWLQGMKALPRAYLGDLAGAQEDLRLGVEIARASDDRASLATMLGASVTLAWFQGDEGRALECAREQLAIAEELGSPTLISGSADSMGVAHAMESRWDRAVALGERALQTARQSTTLLQGEGVLLSNLAAAYLGIGDRDRATALAREAVEICQRRSTPLFECRSRIMLARALIAAAVPEAAAEARHVLDATLKIIERTGARVYEPFVHAELAALARWRGDGAAEARELDTARVQFEAIEAIGQLRRLDRARAA